MTAPKLIIKFTKMATVCLLILCFDQTLADEWPSCGIVDSFPGDSWALAEATDYGWNSDKLTAAEGIFDSLDSAAMMVIHKGHLIANWGDTGQKYLAQSIRKSLLNSLIGISVNQGIIRTDATLRELNINDTKPVLTELERTATIRDLMLSRSGIFHPALYEMGGWKRRRSELAAEKTNGEMDAYRPGNYWIYNNWDFNALGTIVEQVTDSTIGQLFGTNVASKIGMEDYLPEDVEYTTKDSRTEQHFHNWSEHRAYVFNISTRDLARYGLLYMNCGRWLDQKVIPKGWVLESIEGVDTRIGRSSDDRDTHFGGWGYLWQVDRDNYRRYRNLDISEPFYMATGNRGHVMVVMPYLNLVLVHQVATATGISFDVQLKRATEGSPSVSDNDIQRLISAIIVAHPQLQ